MKQTLVINFLGASCSGKSGHAMALAGALKARGLEVGFVSEYCKMFFYDGTQHKLSNQWLVTGKQIEQTDSFIKGGVDVVVTESPIILGAVYAELCGKDEALAHSIFTKFKTYNNYDIKMQSDIEFKSEGRGSGRYNEIVNNCIDGYISVYDKTYKTSELTDYSELIDDILKVIGELND